MLLRKWNLPLSSVICCFAVFNITLPLLDHWINAVTCAHNWSLHRGQRCRLIFPVANYIGRICKHFLQSPMGKHCFVINLKNVLQEIHQFDQLRGKLQSTPYRLTGVQIECWWKTECDQRLIEVFYTVIQIVNVSKSVISAISNRTLPPIKFCMCAAKWKRKFYVTEMLHTSFLGYILLINVCKII